MDTIADTTRREADRLRREAEGLTPDDWLWPQERAALFADVAACYQCEGPDELAQQALWDAALWSSAIIDRGERRKNAGFFDFARFKQALAARSVDGGSGEDQEAQIGKALRYFGSQLAQALAQAVLGGYADFLFTSSQKAPQGRRTYARVAVESYLELAKALDESSYRIVATGDMLFRARKIRTSRWQGYSRMTPCPTASKRNAKPSARPNVIKQRLRQPHSALCAGHRPLRDTDHISALQRNDLRVLLKLQKIPADDLLVTIISVEEQLRGRLAVVHNPKGTLVAAHSALSATYRFYRDARVLPYDADAERTDRALQARVPRMGSKDRRIASIAISRGATLVTGNTIHFQPVPGLVLEKLSSGYGGGGQPSSGPTLWGDDDADIDPQWLLTRRRGGPARHRRVGDGVRIGVSVPGSTQLMSPERLSSTPWAS